MQNKVIVSVLLILVLILFGCGKSKSSHESYTDIRKPISWGKSSVIFAFADDKVWDYGRLEIFKSLERDFFTTTNEKLFNVQREDISKIKNYYKFANLLFLCDTSSNYPTSQYVKSIIPVQTSSLSDLIPADIIAVKDNWSQNQAVVFLIGKDIETLLLYTFQKSNVIFNIYKDSEIRRIKNLIYKPGFNKEEIEYQMKHYPWHFDLPYQYLTFRRDDENNFVSYLLRVEKHPDRFLAVYWENMPEDNVNKQWLWNKRLELGKNYYEGDEFSPEDVTQEKTHFLSYDGYKLYGRWQNPNHFIGGAFVSFAFYDEKQKIGYLIDNAVFFPEGNKLRALLGLEIISKTFKTNYKGINEKKNKVVF
ncbi:MAG: DUF4837 family protein [Candidatus Cloacimonetes bacterium]|nr:DUF4837 family protein [Candidatus Cloacimonadota bacterium]